MSSPNVCAVCETHDADPLYKGLVRCRRCGFVWADSSLGDEQLKELYARNYFFGGEYLDYVAEEKPLLKDFRKAFSLVDRFKKGGRLLELGCAYGFSLNVAREHFDEVTGVEINPEAAAYARERFGLDVRQGDFLAQDLPEGHYDAVVCWATLEHLPAPHRYIEKISRLLKPGGVFAFTTIDIEALLPRLRGAKWRQIHPPTHVSYYSKKTLGLLLEKYGLQPRQWKYLGSNRSVNNMLYGVLVLIQGRRALYERLKRWGLTRGMVYLNLYDTLFGVAEKRRA